MTTRPLGVCCSQPSEPRPLIGGSNISSKNHLILHHRNTLSKPVAVHGHGLHTQVRWTAARNCR